MTYEEKLDIVVNAIKEASKMTPSGYNTKLKITNENKLQDLDLDDISSILYQLQNDQKVITMISTANTNFITGLDPWSDEQDYFALDVLDTFGGWYALHTLKHKSSLENLTFINFLKIYDTLLAIEEEYEITRNVKVVIPLLPSVMRFSALFPGDTIGTRNKFMDDRLKSCDYLKAEGVLKEAGLVAPHQSFDSEVGITINSVNFYPFVKRAKTFYLAHSQPKKDEKPEKTEASTDLALKEKEIWTDDFKWEGKNFFFGKYGSINFTSKDREFILKTLTDKKGGWATISELKGDKDAGYVRSTIKQIEDRLPKKAKGHIIIVSTQDDDSNEKHNTGAYRIKVQP